MTKVLLINQEKIPHYRVGVYNHLSDYLRKKGYALTVVSEGTQPGNTDPVEFEHSEIRLSFLGLARLIRELDPKVIIYWVRLRHLYLFPLILWIKVLRKKAIYWGHGSDLRRTGMMWLKRSANNLEYFLSDALLLYGEHQRRHLRRGFHSKTFIANNTLCFDRYRGGIVDRKKCLAKYNIATTRNIICMGRMQRRKRLEDLLAAFSLLNRQDTGLILVGPDTDGILGGIQGENIYKLGPIYGSDGLDLLSSADVFCLPGAVGLSIVDAFYCGLPLVTEEGDESPEIMYLKDGVNGFVVPKGDVRQLALRLGRLLADDQLRAEFSRQARNEITTNGHIDTMCQGFCDAVDHVCRGQPQGEMRSLEA
jgi:L-malate glycosyltransferase